MTDLASTVRTDVEKLRETIETQLTDDELNLVINSASAIVDTHLASVGLSATMLELIERNLAAHLIATSRERQAQRESIAGEYTVQYTGDYGEGLKMTSYGQTVLMLDTSGKLANLGKKRASIKVFDTPRAGTERPTDDY